MWTEKNKVFVYSSAKTVAYHASYLIGRGCGVQEVKIHSAIDREIDYATPLASLLLAWIGVACQDQ